MSSAISKSRGKRFTFIFDSKLPTRVKIGIFRPGIEFTFVYFNQRTPSSDYYFKFKAVFDLIPLRVIEKMRNFYLIKPYFYIKAFDMLGQSNKILA